MVVQTSAMQSPILDSPGSQDWDHPLVATRSAVGGSGPTAGQGFAGGKRELDFFERSGILELFTGMHARFYRITEGIKELGEIQNFHQAIVIAVVEKHGGLGTLNVGLLWVWRPWPPSRRQLAD